MGGSLKGNGEVIIWKEWALISGMMVVLTKVNIKMTRRMAMVFIFGQMVENIWVIGHGVNNTVLDNIKSPTKKELNMVSGKMESA